MATSPFSESPISDITLPGGLHQRLEGLVVLVGPNSSGKTTLLREIHAAATGQERKLLVCAGVTYRKPVPYEEWIAHVRKTGDVELVRDGVYRQMTHQYGTGGGGAGTERPEKDMLRAHAAFAQGRRQERHLGVDAWLQLSGSLECSALFLDNRLHLTNSSSSFDPESSPPGDTLQALKMNRKAQLELQSEIRRTFERGLWLDASRGTQLFLRITNGPEVPSLEDQLDYKVMRQYETIQTAGEGLRSYVAVCATLLLGRRPLCLIDEPEMCLHPPQARALGHFIGTTATGYAGCVIVATHSSHILRGILEGAGTARVIRLTRPGGEFRARVVAPEVLQEATSKPHSRSEAILDGLFSRGVVVCESEGDRVVYESTAETLDPKFPDVRFVAVGGIGGFRHAVRLYGELGVPVTAVVDLDTIARDELPSLLEDMAPSHAPELRKEILRCRERLRSFKGDASPDEVLRRVHDLASTKWDWAAGDEQNLRGQLSRLAAALNRLAWLKETGLEALNGETRAMTEALLAELRKVGIFLVPVGELESWAAGLMSDVSRSNKAVWATVAAQRIEEHGLGDGDIWEFVQRVMTYLRERSG